MAKRSDHPESAGKSVATSHFTEETPQSGVSGKYSKLMCFTHDEVMTLIEAFNKQKDVLLDPDKRHQHWGYKRDAWLDISKTVNSKNPSRQRTVLQLKEKWKGLLKIARRDYEIVKRAAMNMEPAPDIGKYSELIWDIYGSQIESRFKRRRTWRGKDRSSVAGSAGRSSYRSPKIEWTQDDDNTDSDAYVDDDADGVGEFDHAAYVSQKRGMENTAGYSDPEQPVGLNDDYDTDEYKAPSPPKRSAVDSNKSANNTGSSKTSWKEEYDFDDMMEGDAPPPGDEEQLGYNVKPTTQKKSRDLLIFDETDMDSMRRSLMKAKMSMIALQKTKIESELEKLELEKEKIKMEKQKVEMEMLLIRQKVENLSVEDNSTPSNPK